MVDRVERRLTEIQEEFLLRTEKAAKKIFEENHVLVLGELAASNARVDAITDYHKTQKEMFDELFAQNQAAIVLHNRVEKIFQEESENFFAERIKWKTDV